MTPQNSQAVPSAQEFLLALSRTGRALGAEWDAKISQEKCAASREAPEVLELHLLGAAHKISLHTKLHKI